MALAAILEGSGYVNSTVVSEIGTLLTSIGGWITGNPWLMVFFTFGLVGLGIGLFKSLKGLVRH